MVITDELRLFMTDAVAKTQALERVFLPVDKLEANELNPNEMSDSEFNMLVSNIEEMGITDPILVRPHPEKEGLYRIVGGKHRWEVAKLLDFKEIPCTVVTDETFSEDKEKFQIVRHNIIHGKMSPQKFMKLYNSLTNEYSADAAAEMFGFVDEEEFQKLINQTAKSLPIELQQEFKDAAKEIKTIDDLSKLLNSMFARYGDSLPYGYMVVDYGGKHSFWLRMGPSGFGDMTRLGNRCKKEKRTLDSVFEELIS